MCNEQAAPSRSFRDPGRDSSATALGWKAWTVPWMESSADMEAFPDPFTTMHVYTPTSSRVTSWISRTCIPFFSDIDTRALGCRGTSPCGRHRQLGQKNCSPLSSVLSAANPHGTDTRQAAGLSALGSVITLGEQPEGHPRALTVLYGCAVVFRPAESRCVELV